MNDLVANAIKLTIFYTVYCELFPTNLLSANDFSLSSYMFSLFCAYLTHINDSAFHWFL